ncbi:MAG TPA: pilin [Candidatus Saccharimonadia bacterium]
MNRLVKRTTLTVSAIGLTTVVRAEANLLTTSLEQANHAPATAQTTKDTSATTGNIISEAIAIVTGQVDSVSASSSENSGASQQTCANGTVWDSNSRSCVTVTDTLQTEHSGSRISQSPDVTPGPNPFTSPETCVSIALPLLANGSRCIDNNPADGGAIVTYAKDAAKLLSLAIGGVIVFMVIVAGVQYIASLGNPTRIAAAKQRITNAITALVLFAMAFAIINFLIPGGLVG